MSTSGKPTREQLEQHYKTSRKYFDDMAEHYKETDPEYYNSTVAPIIRKNRFTEGGYSDGYGDGVPKRGMMLTVTVALALLGISMGLFFLFSSSPEEPNPVDKMFEKTGDNQNTRAPIREITPRTKTEEKPVDSPEGDMTNLEKGVFYYDQGAYSMALEYFLQVKEGSDDYDDARKYIEEINGMPDEDKNGTPREDEAPKMNK